MDPTIPAVSTAGSVACVAVAEYVYRPLTTKHRRAGSTGTTGDEEYTTDEEELYPEEAECPGGTTHPILKSDLARAATDLFGYEAKDNEDDEDDEDDEPTGLFDEDEKKFPFTGIAKSYNEEIPCEAAATIPPGSRSSHVAHDPTQPKSTNPFYASLRTNIGTSNGEENEARPEFHMCKRPTDLKLVSCTSATESPDSTAGIEELPRPTHSPESSNPFCDSSHDDETNITSREDGAKLTNRSPCISIPSIETKDLVKSEVEARSRQELYTSCRRSTSTYEYEARADSPTTVQWGRAVAEVKEHAVAKLQDELRRAHEELKLKAEEVTRLSRIRQDVETELEDLTASLFQEAHNMVREANVRQATAERLLAESRMKSEVLAAEVAALKTLVLTSTPARPNPHLHPQIDSRGRDETPGGLFAKRHRRSPSHFNLKYGRENSPPDSPVKEQRASLPAETLNEPRDPRDGLEVDPIVHKEFLQWKANPCVDKADPFVKRIFREDIDLCLDFANKELGAKVRQAVLDGIVFVEAVSDKTKVAFPKKCALLEAPRQCHYRMRLGDQENHWHSISQICRNRIIAVCDFLNYLRYIERGLVKSSVHDIYWEITRLRKEMVLARLGLALSS